MGQIRVALEHEGGETLQAVDLVGGDVALRGPEAPDDIGHHEQIEVAGERRNNGAGLTGGVERLDFQAANLQISVVILLDRLNYDVGLAAGCLANAGLLLGVG